MRFVYLLSLFLASAIGVSASEAQQDTSVSAAAFSQFLCEEKEGEATILRIELRKKSENAYVLNHLLLVDRDEKGNLLEQPLVTDTSHLVFCQQDGLDPMKVLCSGTQAYLNSNNTYTNQDIIHFAISPKDPRISYRVLRADCKIQMDLK
ncbi:MAG: hypothetical protein AB7F59_03730 [Bdellovibrionales bacterium]